MTSTTGITLAGADDPAVDTLVARLAREDLFGQLLDRRGRAAELAREGEDVKLDWVDGVEQALAHPEWLAAAEAEAEEIVGLGIEHVIWSGMGGSVQTLYALKHMGFLDSGPMTIYPCDSTDPASLNRLVLELAERAGVPLREALAAGNQTERNRILTDLFARTMMIGVSMGMTSEEPITHLEWFDGVLTELGIPNAGDHIQVMTLPDSYLDRFARPRGAKMVPIQLDARNSTPGRMSAPATRVFIRPVALRLIAESLAGGPPRPAQGQLLAHVLRRAQDLYGLSHETDADMRKAQVGSDPFVRLGAFISAEVTKRGRNKVLLVMPGRWAGLFPWLEQLVEESLGKGGKGFLVFSGADLQPADTYGPDVLLLHVRIAGTDCPHAGQLGEFRAAGVPVLELDVPMREQPGVPAGLGETAALFANFKKTVVTFGYLQGIVYAGQPAVEAYKQYARDLREAAGPVPFPTDTPHQARFQSLTLYYNSLVETGRMTAAEVAEDADPGDAVAVYAAILRTAREKFAFRYLDFTFNGELPPAAREVFEEARRELAGKALGMPAKIRTGPSDYHSTEQSETDGPPELVSTRFVALEHEPVIVGQYSDKFLMAQARGTWQAMEDAGRWILMLTFPRLTEEVVVQLRSFFQAVADRVASP